MPNDVIDSQSLSRPDHEDLDPDIDPVLASLPIMAPLSESEKALVAECFTPVRFDFGDTVVHQGESATAYFVIRSGRARVLTEGPDGREVALNLLTAGDTFGEVALIEDAPRSATVRASSPLELWRLDRTVFLALLRVHPALRRTFWASTRPFRVGDVLRIHPAFQEVPRPRLMDLIEHIDMLTLSDEHEAAGGAVANDGWYLVAAGRITLRLGDGGEPYHLHPGDVFYVDPRKREHWSIRSQGEALVLRIEGEAVANLVAEHPAVGKRLAEREAIVKRRLRQRPPRPADRRPLPASTEEDLLAEIAQQDDRPASTRPARRRWFHRFAYVPGHDAMDCGVSCVATLCREFGYKVSLPAIRVAVGKGLDGTSLRGIIRGGAEIGIEFRAIKTSLDRLANLPLPVILHWGGNHWVVLHELKGNRVLLADPAFGLRTVTRNELAAEWSGYVAIPTPTPRLAQAPRAGLSLGWLRPFVRPHYGALVGAAGLALLATALQMSLPVLTQVVVDGLLHRQGTLQTSFTVGVIVLALLLAVGVTILQRRTLARVAVAIDAKALDHLAERLLRLPLGYFQIRRTADIQRRLEGIREVRRVLVEDGVVGLTAALQLIVAVAVMLSYSLPAGLLFLGVLPVYALLMAYSSRRLKPTMDALEEAFGRYQGKQQDSIRGIEAVKVSGAEDGFRRSLLKEFESLQDRLYRRDVVVLVYEGLVSLASLMVVALFLWVGALLVETGHLTVGGLVAINGLVLLANSPLRILLSLWDQLQYVGVLLARLQDVHQHKPEESSTETALPVAELAGHVRLRGVGFHYQQSPEQQVLEGISLDVPAGLTVAVVGRSGSGKSTLLRCLAGLTPTTAGSIEYDGQELRLLNLRELRSRIGFVLQESYLFDATIAENIAFGHPVDLDLVREAAEVANAAEFIERLPLGYQTRVGDSGLKVSTGQAQRIAIARAVYAHPPVLLMDEPTSALDAEAERAVKEGIDRLLQGRTVFVVAHRLSTIRDADLICVLDDGRLVEQGTHDELMERNGLYAYLCAQQLAS